jgi:hypothetical protein
MEPIGFPNIGIWQYARIIYMQKYTFYRIK